jgi:hypothetical protein
MRFLVHSWCATNFKITPPASSPQYIPMTCKWKELSWRKTREYQAVFPHIWTMNITIVMSYDVMVRVKVNIQLRFHIYDSWEIDWNIYPLPLPWRHMVIVGIWWSQWLYSQVIYKETQPVRLKCSPHGPSRMGVRVRVECSGLQGKGKYDNLCLIISHKVTGARKAPACNFDDA